MTREEYFKDSKVRNADGSLMVCYHGTNAKFTVIDLHPQYDDEHGEDQYGSAALYTTTSKNYAQAHGENVMELYMNITNPLLVDGVQHANLRHVEIDAETAYKMLCCHPDLYINPMDKEVGGKNPMWDYFDLNGVQFKKPTDAIPYIRRLANEYFDESNLLLLDVFFGRKYRTEYLDAMYDVMGYDGICVQFENSQHWLAFFPAQVKFTDNKSPEHSADMAH